MIKKIKFYRSLLVEIIETLCTICLYLERDGRYTHNETGVHMHSHFEELKKFSEELRSIKR
jgi:hypothetical protein